MTILIGKYEFDGPYSNVDDIEEMQGIYAVLHYEGREFKFIYVAQSDNIRERIELSKPAYNPTTETILLAAYYTPQCGTQERRMMVEDIQREFYDQGNQKCDNQILTGIAS